MITTAQFKAARKAQNDAMVQAELDRLPVKDRGDMGMRAALESIQSSQGIQIRQSRLASLGETCLGIAIGFAVSLVITAWLLPAYGHPVSWLDNLQITAVYTVASIARGYVVRRMFNRWFTA